MSRSPSSRSWHRWALVLLAVAGGVGLGMGTGLGAAKEIHLTVDGEEITLHSFADTVQGALDATDVSVGEGDHVSPSPTVRVADGMEVVVRHARSLTLIKDGKKYVRRVTALNVADALRELDIDGHRARLSASLMRQIPMSGFKLKMVTMRRVVVVRDGARVRAVTTSRTVREVLAQKKIKLAVGERVRPALNAFPREGQVIRILPVTSPTASPAASPTPQPPSPTKSPTPTITH